MATFHVDFLNGNDANDGSAWALAWKTLTTGATSARIAAGDIIKMAKAPPPFSIGDAEWRIDAPNYAATTITSSTDSTPIKINRNGHGLVDGDIIIVAAHTVNVNANGTWRVTIDGGNAFFLDNSIGTGAGNGAATGSFFKVNNKAVVLDTAGLTKKIDDCSVAWANANGSTVALQAYAAAKVGGGCMRITTPAAPAANTLYAYRTLIGQPIDFSGYQKISFWLYNQHAFLAGRWKICLCSDTAGATIVDTFDVPAIPSVTTWMPLTLIKSGGGNLGAAIRSIALYSAGTAPQGSSYVQIDGFIACTTDGINLNSLLSKDDTEQANEHGWYGIESIDYKIILLDNHTGSVVNTGRGYHGIAKETVETFARQPIPVDMQATAMATTVGTINQDGNAGNWIKFEGGFDIVSGDQDGETILDFFNGLGYGFNTNSKNFIEVNHVGIVRAREGIRINGAANRNFKGFNLAGMNCTTIGIYLYYYNQSLDIDWLIAINGAGEGLSMQMLSGMTIKRIINCSNIIGRGIYHREFKDFTYDEIRILNNNSGVALDCTAFVPNYTNNNVFTLIKEVCKNTGSSCFSFAGNGNVIKKIEKANSNSNSAGIFSFTLYSHNLIREIEQMNDNAVCFNSSAGGRNNRIKLVTEAKRNTQIVTDSGGIKIDKITTENTSTRIVNATPTNGMITVVNNWSGNEVEEILANPTVNTAGDSGEARFTNVGGDVEDHRIYVGGGNIKTDKATKYSATGVSWKWTFTGTTRTIAYPIGMVIAKVAVVANKDVTIKAWVRRNNLTDIAFRLRIIGSQLPGIGLDDLIVEAGAGSDAAWEQITLPVFKPTVAGVVEVLAEAYYLAGLGSAWIDEMTIEQEV